MSLTDLPDQIKAAWGWYDRPDWQAQFRALRDSGHNMMLRKAGIDTLDGSTPAIWQQWSKQRNDVLRSYGIEPVMFLFTWMGKQFGWPTENNAIVRLCNIDLPRRIVLNYETQVDNMTAAEATGYLTGLRTVLINQYADRAPALDNSSVPSWDGGRYGGSPYHNIPYETVSALTEIDWYQNYWDEANVQGGYDWQDSFQQLRGVPGPNKLVVPSWIVGKDPVVFADWADSRGYSGICGWESGNASYDFARVAQAWPHLDNRIDRLGTIDAEWAKVTGNLWDRYTNVKADFPQVVGLPLYEGRLDLSQVAPGLPSEAAYLKTEKGTLWSAIGLGVEWMHDGQFAQVERDNLAAGRLAVRYGQGAEKLPPVRG